MTDKDRYDRERQIKTQTDRNYRNRQILQRQIQTDIIDRNRQIKQIQTDRSDRVTDRQDRLTDITDRDIFERERKM